MAVIEVEGLLQGRRLRACSPMARLLWPYFFLMANGYARIELDFEAIADRFASFRTAAPTPTDIAAYFAEYAAAHLAIVYEANGRKWVQWDTRRSNLKDYKSAADRTSPAPEDRKYIPWLKEQHGGEWQAFHWNSAASDDFCSKVPKTSKSLRAESDGGGVGVGEGNGVGGGKETTLASRALLPDWLPADLWEKFEDHRRKLRKPMTSHAITLSIEKLAKWKSEGFDPKQIIEDSIANGWVGLFAKKENQRNGGFTNGDSRAKRAQDSVLASGAQAKDYFRAASGK